MKKRRAALTASTKALCILCVFAALMTVFCACSAPKPIVTGSYKSHIIYKLDTIDTFPDSGLEGRKTKTIEFNGTTYKCYYSATLVLEEEDVLPGSRVHSAIVVNTPSGKRLASKWGDGGLYLHDMSNHPYANSTIRDHGTVIITPRKISVFRPNHTNDSSINPLMSKYRMIDDFEHEVLCAYCSRNVDQTESHSFVSIGALTKCSKCGYIQGVSPNHQGNQLES